MEIKEIKKAKEYCKIHKLKLEEFTKTGFIASKLIPVRAGMKYKAGTCKLMSIPIKKIGSKRIYTDFISFPDGDIVDNGIVNY